MIDISTLLPGFDLNRITTTVGAVPVQICPANPKRPAIYVTNPSEMSALGIVIGALPAGPLVPDVIVEPGTTHRFTWIEDGPTSTYGMLGYYDFGSGLVVVTEVMWHPEQLPGV